MKTAAECLVKADHLDALALERPAGRIRNGYLDAACGWRRLAVLAGQQEDWVAAHPD